MLFKTIKTLLVSFNNCAEEPLAPEEAGRNHKHFLHPTMKVRSLMGSDVDYINDQITKVTRLPNAPDRSLPHLGNTGHLSQQQPQQTPGQMRSLGSFSVVVPIYLGAIFVFFIYIVSKVQREIRHLKLIIDFSVADNSEET